MFAVVVDSICSNELVVVDEMIGVCSSVFWQSLVFSETHPLNPKRLVFKQNFIMCLLSQDCEFAKKISIPKQMIAFMIVDCLLLSNIKLSIIIQVCYNASSAY